MSLEQSLARLAVELPEFEPGHVWLAGAGPGAAGCLTLDVVSALSQADAIVYDALVDPSILDRDLPALVGASSSGGNSASLRTGGAPRA